MRDADRPVTVITGTRKGIGKALALHFLEEGHHVVGCSRSAPEWSHERYRHTTVDVADEQSVARLFDDIRREYGRADHLLNNAGRAAMNHSLLTTGSQLRTVFQTNVFGTFFCSREAAKLMQKRRHGRIVNFSSVAVAMKLEGEAIYVGSKAAVVSLTEVLARELGAFGITVNAVGPPPVDTDLIKGVPEEKICSIVARQAIQRRATMKDIANVVDFFLRPESDLVTGQTIYLGGAS